MSRIIITIVVIIATIVQTNKLTMIPGHHEVFYKVANALNCWIGLREPNHLSDKYVGSSAYVAKGVNCKAKTADSNTHQFGGLVVNPELCPAAFLRGSLLMALNKWKEFDFALPAGFSYVKDGSEKGLVKFQGKGIHADYDLMYVCKADPNGKIIYTKGNDSGTRNPELRALMIKVKNELNRSFGKDMIMHGTEFDYRGMGAREREMIFSYGPKRQLVMNKSSMLWNMPH